MPIPKHKTGLLRRLLPSLLILVWLVVVGIGAPFFAKIGEQSSTDLTTFLPSSSDAAKVNQNLSEFRDKNFIPVVIAYDKGGEKLTNDDESSIAHVNESMAGVPDVSGAINKPLISEDKKAAIVAVPLRSDADFESAFVGIRQKISDARLDVSHTFTGPASFARDLQNAFSGIDSTLLFVAMGVVFLILLAVYRSPFLPFIVLFTAMSALSVVVWIVYHLASAGIVQLNGQVQGILFILVIGAATDYSLLYIARYREELTNHRDKWRATLAALKASYEPILAAGGTVAAGLLCLLLSDLGSNRALGPVGGMGIAFSILAALTLLPALLYLFGGAVFWPRRPHYVPHKTERDYTKNHPVWAKVGSLVRRHPRRVWAGSVVVLLVACVGVFQLKAEGVAQNNLIIGKSEAREGQAILDAHFPSGVGSPAYIIADQTKQSEIVALLDNDKGVDSVSVTATNVSINTFPVGQAKNELYQKVRDAVEQKRQQKIAALQSSMGMQRPSGSVPAQASAIPSIDQLTTEAYPYKDAVAKIANGRVLLQATLTDPADSITARKTIMRLRDGVSNIDNMAIIGGITASQLDTNESSLRDVKVIIPAILVAVTIILMLLLRSVVAPLVLLVTTVMSFGATIGISALLFNHLWDYPGADPAVIIFAFVFLVAFGIDYNIFLMTRVREETMKLGVARGTIKGLVVTGGVITSAGIVLAATFAALNVIPILFLVQIAFIVAFGVLLDTMLVRSLLVPALTLEIGRFMWWPSRLWRHAKKSRH